MFAAALPYLISGAAALGGSALSYFGQRGSNESNIHIADSTNAFSAAQAQLNRDFQERMSNTSWQRGVVDMRKAGINPALAFSQGGASVPSGSAASGVTGAPQQNALSAFANTALQMAQIQNVRANTAKTVAETINTSALNPVSSALHDASAKGVDTMRSIVKDLPKYLGGVMFDVSQKASAFHLHRAPEAARISDFGNYFRHYR